MLICISIMSLCAFLAIIAMDEGKERLAILLCGPVAWAWVIVRGSIYALYQYLKLYHFRNHYSALFLMCNGHSWTTYYVRNELVNAFYVEGDDSKYYVKEIRSCKSAKSLPYKQYIINKNGFLAKSDNSKFLSNFVRPSWDLYNKLNK